MRACLHGVLAGYPVVYLKADAGATAPTTRWTPPRSLSRPAANLAFKAALPEAKPVLLEPIGELKVTVPDNYMGDVMGDLNKRRGRVMGMNPTGDGETVLEAEVPMAEMMQLRHRSAVHDPVPWYLHLQLRPLRGLPRCGAGEGHCRGQGSGRCRVKLL